MQQHRPGVCRQLDDLLVRENPLRLVVNGRHTLTISCSPSHLTEWAYGHLWTEGLIASVDEVRTLSMDDGYLTIGLRVQQELPSEPVPVVSSLRVPLPRVLELALAASARANVFRSTGGTHHAALADRHGIHSLLEDISRSCALEKIAGRMLMDGLSGGDKLLLLSGRVALRAVRAAARMRLPIVAAASAPTADAARLADRLGICLCGFVREERANVYTHAWRVAAR